MIHVRHDLFAKSVSIKQSFWCNNFSTAAKRENFFVICFFPPDFWSFPFCKQTGGWKRTCYLSRSYLLFSRCGTVSWGSAGQQGWSYWSTAGPGWALGEDLSYYSESGKKKRHPHTEVRGGKLCVCVCVCVGVQYVFWSCHLESLMALVIITLVYIIRKCLQCQQRGVDLGDKRK